MLKFKGELLATDLALWRKKGIFSVFLILCLLPLVIIYMNIQTDLEQGLWQLRYFIGIAIIQGIAQVLLAWYMLKNTVPNYVILSLAIVFIFSELTLSLTVIFISNAI